MNKEIWSEKECKQAATELGFQWGNSWDGPGDFPACLYVEDGNKNVHFNLSPKPARTNVNPKYAAICTERGKSPNFVKVAIGNLCQDY